MASICLGLDVSKGNMFSNEIMYACMLAQKVVMYLNVESVSMLRHHHDSRKEQWLAPISYSHPRKEW